MEIIHDKKGRALKISVSWCLEDVLWRAKDRGLKISKDEASEVLGLMYKHHDASIGLSWEVIDVWMDGIIAERKKR